MLMLGMDTAASGVGLCLWRDGACLDAFYESMERGQDAFLVPAVLRLLAKHALSFESLDRLAVTSGPGSFTGVRVGLAAAKGFALAAQKPLLAVSRFAIHAAQQLSKPGALPLLVALASKRAELYIEYIGHDGKPESPTMKKPEDLPAYGACRVAGDALPLLQSVFHPLWRGAEALPLRESEVVTCCRLAEKADLDDPAFAAKPFYLRPPDVTMPKETPALPVVSSPA